MQAIDNRTKTKNGIERLRDPNTYLIPYFTDNYCQQFGQW